MSNQVVKKDGIAKSVTLRPWLDVVALAGELQPAGELMADKGRRADQRRARGVGGGAMRNLLGVVLVLAVAACVSERPQYVASSTFDPNEVEWAGKDGGNTVTGFAVLRTVGGEARTCAGLEVRIVPDSTHARERIQTIYGNLEKGSKPWAYAQKFATTDTTYVAASRSTRCDGQGNFSFERVPSGTWYVIASVIWQANPRSGIYEGGLMMKRIVLQGNTTMKVVLP